VLDRALQEHRRLEREEAGSQKTAAIPKATAKAAGTQAGRLRVAEIE
jgi:hypothetical protein